MAAEENVGTQEELKRPSLFKSAMLAWATAPMLIYCCYIHHLMAGHQ